MLTKMVNGEEVILSPEAEAAMRGEWAVNKTKSDARLLKENEFKAKRNADIASLGNRASFIAEVDSANSVPELRAVVRKLAEIVYTEVNKTID